MIHTHYSKDGVLGTKYQPFVDCYIRQEDAGVTELLTLTGTVLIIERWGIGGMGCTTNLDTIKHFVKEIKKEQLIKDLLLGHKIACRLRKEELIPKE